MRVNTSGDAHLNKDFFFSLYSEGGGGESSSSRSFLWSAHRSSSSQICDTFACQVSSPLNNTVFRFLTCANCISEFYSVTRKGLESHHSVMAKSKKPDPATGTGTPLSEVVASPPKSANASPPPNGTSQSEDKSSSPPPAPRRSTRRVVKPKPFDSNADFVPAAADSITGAKSSASTNGKKRANPKRKAAGSSLARRPTVPDADLLEEALRPLLQSEIDDWEGWVELESEPVRFLPPSKQLS